MKSSAETGWLMKARPREQVHPEVRPGDCCRAVDSYARLHADDVGTSEYCLHIGCAIRGDGRGALRDVASWPFLQLVHPRGLTTAGWVFCTPGAKQPKKTCR